MEKRKKTLRKRYAIKSWLALLVLFSAVVPAYAGNVAWNPISGNINPILDGQATSTDEWKYANWAPNDQGDGTFYAEWKKNWNATSSSGNSATYNGITLFDMHNMDAATTKDAADYNVFSYNLPSGGTLTAWVFANADESNDNLWIGNSGLGLTSIDDRGFLVRLNNDPSTDRQWLPGDSEPGDSGFDWSLFYGFFGTSGFNNSVWEMGLPGIVSNGSNEVYEVALYGPAIVGGGGDVQPCITDIYRTVKDPKNGDPSQVLVGQMVGPGHVNTPEPTTFLLLGFGLGSYAAFKKSRKRRES